jgi:hypothetical protein
MLCARVRVGISPTISFLLLPLEVLMSRMMEQLESRVLFIATAGVILADLDAVKAQGVVAKSELKSALATATADMKALKATVKAASPTATQKADFTALVKDEAGIATKYKLRVTNILASGTRDGVHLFTVLESLRAHPNSVVIQAKVAASLAALQGVFSDTVLGNVETQAGASVTTLDTDANVLAGAVPSTQGNVNTFEMDLANDLTTLSTQGSAIQGAIATLAGALA